MSPRDSHSRGLIDLQASWIAPVADDRYVADRAWVHAVLDKCPFHPSGGCGAERHGSYPRVHPRGARIPRFRCPEQRLLTNYAMDSENRLCVILVGHPELRRRLGMSALEALAQRVVVRAHLRGVTREEIGPYLEHRLHLAGCELALFEPATVEAIHQASNGLPRKVNLLAHHALFAAALAKAKSVTTEHVQVALQEVA